MNGSAGSGSGALPAASEALTGYMEAMLHDSTSTAGPAGPSPEANTRQPPVSPPTGAVLPGGVVRTDGTIAETSGPMAVQVFSVAGLKLALPSAKIGTVVDAAVLTAPSADCMPWIIGTLGVADRIVKVVNPCGIILPPERQPVAWRPVAVIVFRNSSWGLGCDGYLAATSLEPGEVHWRTARTRRSWLAGTVSRLGYALMDVDALAALFDQETKS